MGCRHSWATTNFSSSSVFSATKSGWNLTHLPLVAAVGGLSVSSKVIGMFSAIVPMNGCSRINEVRALARRRIIALVSAGLYWVCGLRLVGITEVMAVSFFD